MNKIIRIICRALLVCLAFTSVATGKTIFVDIDAVGANNGMSWANAYKYLQVALGSARSGDEIRVAEGVYKPDEDTDHPNGSGSRYATFQLKNGVAIKGGYAGYGEPDPDERDPNTYETILSGDLNGNDGPDFANNGENSYHVLTGKWTNATAVLDGFTIAGGNASAGAPYNRGGGVYNYSGSPTVTNCTFSDNSAELGGGMGNYRSSPTLTNCTFSGNSADLDGGGMWNGHSSPVLTNCRFDGNGAGGGGGLCNTFSGSPRLTNCTFSDNWAGTGGGMLNDRPCSPNLTNCTFSDNSAGDGGGISNWGGSLTLTNCMFSGNSADGDGGGMANFINSPALTNCTFSGNSASRGGGMCDLFESNPTLTNCILWGNTAPSGSQIYDQGTSSATVSYSDVQGGWPGTGNINADPLFVGPDSNDYHLLPTSPCIDAADNNSVPADMSDLDGDGDTNEPIPWDLDCNPRFVDQPEVPDTGNGTAPIVDMGAFEADYIKVPMHFTPKVLNPRSKGKWVKAHFVLAEEFGVEDVDANTPAVIEPLGIESEYMNIFINEDELVEIEAAFSRSDFCSNGPTDGTVIVIGRLTTGQSFYGTDTIRILNKSFEQLAVFVSHWLEAGCRHPDWCGGSDLDRDSVVNFADFALLNGCCIKFTGQ